MGKAPFGLEAVSDISLLSAFLLILVLFWIAYSIWDVLFYLLFGGLVLGAIYRFAAKVQGISVNESENPKIFALAKSVAEATGTRIPDEIIVTPLTEIGVSGIFKRKLLIGCASLTALSAADLYAILFHEFAHFRGYDNIIGSSLMSTTYAFRDIVSASRYIPTILGLIIVLVLLAFYYAYAAATLLYSRQREYMADWVASSIIGGAAFGDALERYIRSTNDFGLKLNPIINSYASRNLKLTNLYDAVRRIKVTISKEDLARIEANERRMYENASWLSTHPATKSRITRIRGIKGSIGKLPKGSASELFKDLGKMEPELTDIIYSRMVRKPGVPQQIMPKGPPERIGKQKITREDGYLIYLGMDGYVWHVPTKDNPSGKKERIGDEKFERDPAYMYFVDKDGYVSRAKIAG